MLWYHHDQNANLYVGKTKYSVMQLQDEPPTYVQQDQNQNQKKQQYPLQSSAKQPMKQGTFSNSRTLKRKDWPTILSIASSP